MIALLCAIILAGMVGTLTMLSTADTNVVLDVRQLELARVTAMAGLNLVVADFQQDQAPPPKDWYDAPQPFGGGTFQILRDEALGGPEQRRVVEIQATFDTAEWGIEAIIGPETRPLFDKAIQANSDMLVDNNAKVDSYDSTVGPYDFKNPTGNGDVQGNGNIQLKDHGTLLGDLGVIGTITLEGNASVSGDQVEGADPIYVPSPDPVIAAAVAKLSASNDNGSLQPSIVEIKDGMDMIHVQTNKTGTITAGGYYLHSMILENNSQLNLDTTGGPIHLVFDSTDDVFLKNRSTIEVTGGNPVYLYLANSNLFKMDNRAHVTNAWDRADLFMVMAGSNSPGQPRLEMSNNAEYYGTMWAPDSDFIMQNEFDIYGAIICNKIHLKNHTSLHYDEALAKGLIILVPDSYRVHFRRRVI